MDEEYLGVKLIFTIIALVKMIVNRELAEGRAIASNLRCGLARGIIDELTERSSSMQSLPTGNPNSLLSHFSTLTDPRVERTLAHPLSNILVIAICAIICGADDWVAIEDYGEAKREWLSGFLDLSNGIPAHDTFGRVFGLLDPDELRACFVSWIKSIAHLTAGEVIAIDGKKLNGSADAPKKLFEK